MITPVFSQMDLIKEMQSKPSPSGSPKSRRIIEKNFLSKITLALAIVVAVVQLNLELSRN